MLPAGDIPAAWPLTFGEEPALLPGAHQVQVSSTYLCPVTPAAFVCLGRGGAVKQKEVRLRGLALHGWTQIPAPPLTGEVALALHSQNAMSSAVTRDQ